MVELRHLFISSVSTICESGVVKIHGGSHFFLQFIRKVVLHMPVIRVRENEPFDVALRRFKRSCEKAGILADVRAREFYEKPTTVRKRAKASAIKRHAKKLARENARRTRLY